MLYLDFKIFFIISLCVIVYIIIEIIIGFLNILKIFKFKEKLLYIKNFFILFLFYLLKLLEVKFKIRLFLNRK